MCLYYDKKYTKIFKKRKKKRFFVYKVLELEGGKLHSPYISFFNTRLNWKPGYIKSNRLSNKISLCDAYNRYISKGIHIFLKKYDAIRLKTYGKNYVIIRLEVNMKDFVAASRTEAVFTKVRLYKKEYIKCLNSLKVIKS